MSIAHSELRALVGAQVGRPMRSDVTQVGACNLGLPTVVGVPPFLDDGTPFPTMYWLSCPLAVKRIGRLEGMGAVKQLQEYGIANPEFAQALEERHAEVAVERNREIGDRPGPRPSGGVAGTTTGVKCLHAHYADEVGDGRNPVGKVTAPFVEPLICPTPCVVRNDGIWSKNPEWSEPR